MVDETMVIANLAGSLVSLIMFGSCWRGSLDRHSYLTGATGFYILLFIITVHAILRRKAKTCKSYALIALICGLFAMNVIDFGAPPFFGEQIRTLTAE